MISHDVQLVIPGKRSATRNPEYTPKIFVDSGFCPCGQPRNDGFFHRLSFMANQKRRWDRRACPRIRVGVVPHEMLTASVATTDQAKDKRERWAALGRRVDTAGAVCPRPRICTMRSARDSRHVSLFERPMFAPGRCGSSATERRSSWRSCFGLLNAW